MMNFIAKKWNTKFHLDLSKFLVNCKWCGCDHGQAWYHPSHINHQLKCANLYCGQEAMFTQNITQLGNMIIAYLGNLSQLDNTTQLSILPNWSLSLSVIVMMTKMSVKYQWLNLEMLTSSLKLRKLLLIWGMIIIMVWGSCRFFRLPIHQEPIHQEAYLVGMPWKPRNQQNQDLKTPESSDARVADDCHLKSTIAGSSFVFCVYVYT